MARTNAELYNLQTKALCYITTVHPFDKRKVEKARRGEASPQPSSNIAKVAWELGWKAYRDEQANQPPPPPPPPVIRKDIHPPLSYSEGITGEPSARYNVRINCIPTAGGYVDRAGLTYDEGGRSRGGRATVYVAGLKRADMMDQKEPWEAYEWMGNTYGPGVDDYPDECFKL